MKESMGGDHVKFRNKLKLNVASLMTHLDTSQAYRKWLSLGGLKALRIAPSNPGSSREGSLTDPDRPSTVVTVPSKLLAPTACTCVDCSERCSDFHHFATPVLNKSKDFFFTPAIRSRKCSLFSESISGLRDSCPSIAPRKSQYLFFSVLMPAHGDFNAAF